MRKENSPTLSLSHSRMIPDQDPKITWPSRSILPTTGKSIPNQNWIQECKDILITIFQCLCTRLIILTKISSSLQSSTIKHTKELTTSTLKIIKTILKATKECLLTTTILIIIQCTINFIWDHHQTKKSTKIILTKKKTNYTTSRTNMRCLTIGLIILIICLPCPQFLRWLNKKQNT